MKRKQIADTYDMDCSHGDTVAARVVAAAFCDLATVAKLAVFAAVAIMHKFYNDYQCHDFFDFVELVKLLDFYCLLDKYNLNLSKWSNN